MREIKFRLTQEGIMQYTGLKDKNGTEIYEGDLLENGEFHLKVRFEEGTFTCTNRESPIMPLYMSHSYMEVVGNVYENPELLEGV
jgi:uncharacterized phage protein (TIGR01671 family)